MKSVTGIIVTLNEEQRIQEAILSLKRICSEIIVVDSGSMDRTLEIAAGEGARTYSQHYLGDGQQKNFGQNIKIGSLI